MGNLSLTIIIHYDQDLQLGVGLGHTKIQHSTKCSLFALGFACRFAGGTLSSTPVVFCGRRVFFS